MTRIFISILFLVTGILCSNTFQAAGQELGEIHMRLQPDTIRAGDSATLFWNAPGNDSIYISSVGYVAPSDSLRVSPSQSVTYTAVAMLDSHSLEKSIHLTVTGGRGGNEFPSLGAPFSYSLRAWQTPPLPRLLARIWKVLQDSCNLSVLDYSIGSEGQYIFLTSRWNRPDLLDRNNQRINGRRIAFRIIVHTAPTPDGELRYDIATLVEYRRTIIRDWAVEDNPTVAQSESRRLRQLIGSVR